MFKIYTIYSKLSLLLNLILTVPIGPLYVIIGLWEPSTYLTLVRLVCTRLSQDSNLDVKNIKIRCCEVNIRGEISHVSLEKNVVEVVFVSHKWLGSNPLQPVAIKEVIRYLKKKRLNSCFFWVDFLCVDQQSSTLLSDVSDAMVLIPYFKDMIVVKQLKNLYNQSAWCYFENALRGKYFEPNMLCVRNKADKEIMMSFVMRACEMTDHSQSCWKVYFIGLPVVQMINSIKKMSYSNINIASEVMRPSIEVTIRELLAIRILILVLLAPFYLVLVVISCFTMIEYSAQTIVNTLSVKMKAFDVKVAYMEEKLIIDDKFNYQLSKDILVDLRNDDVDEPRSLKNYSSIITIRDLNGMDKGRALEVLSNLNTFGKVLINSQDPFLSKLYGLLRGEVYYNENIYPIQDWPFSNFSPIDLSKSLSFQWVKAERSQETKEIRLYIRKSSEESTIVSGPTGA